MAKNSEKPKKVETRFGGKVNSSRSLGIYYESGYKHLEKRLKSAQETIDKKDKERRDLSSKTFAQDRGLRKASEEDETRPVSRFLLYPAIFLASFAGGVYRGYCIKHSKEMVPGLDSMIIYALPVAGCVLGAFHEAGIKGGFDLTELGAAELLGGAGGGIGSAVSQSFGYFVGSLL